MAKKPGDTFGFQFTTQGSTGALASADSLPVGTMVRNGVDDTGTGTTITIANVSTGIYKATGTIPSGYVKGDDFQVRINATVAGVSSGALRDYGALDSKRVGDLTDAPAAPTAAQVATSVWQDATAGDFTVTGSIGKYIMTGVTINLAQSGFTPRNLGTVADAALTVGDALMAAICAAAGKETVVGTTYTIMSPSTGSVIRTFALDSGTAPSSRT